MHDAVDRLILERQSMNDGFPRSLSLSLGVHAIVGALLLAALLPQRPVLPSGPAVEMGRLVGSSGHAEHASAGARQPPLVLKPPVDTGPCTRSETAAPRNRASATQATSSPASADPTPGRPQSDPSQEPAVLLVDRAGDWYLAIVQSRIWSIWASHAHEAAHAPVIVEFAILENGSVVDPRLVQTGGSSILDRAALGAIRSAAPFSSLPKHYDTERFVVRAIFKPEP